MTAPKKDAPRRYIVDSAGQRVLVGLTILETIEFEALDNPGIRPDSADLPDEECGVRQDKRAQRWLELYIKHERAWSDWMAEMRARLDEPRLLA